MTDLNFTKRTIDALPNPEKGRRVTYHDKKTPSLALRVSSNGSKSFIVRRKVNGRAERVTLGKYPLMTIEQARKQAAETNAVIAKGESVNEKKRAIRDEMRFGELFKVYLERYAKMHKKSWKNDVSQYEKHLRKLSNRKLSDIRKQDIQTIHLITGDESGIYAANRLLALIHVIFARANEWGWQGSNPASGIKKFKEQARERFLDADELPRFFESLAQETNSMYKDYFLLAILTGARRSNLLAMRWDEINFERAVWIIPHHKAKTKENYHIPLVSEVITVLKQRKANRISVWVFPSTGKTGHLVEPKKAWKRIVERAKLSDLRMHDLRRSFGSWQAATGASLSVIGKSLGHKNINTTTIYARLNIDPVREAMETATSAMMIAGGMQSSAEIVDINALKKK
jgi:integrase